MPIRSFTSLSLPEWFAPVLVAVVWIALFSFLKEPGRRRLSAIMVAGAGAAYLNGGFGGWEFAFCALITFLAYRGLENYRFIGAAWILHTGWDVLHHLYGNPIVPFALTSSAGCAICDPILAIWYWFGARSMYTWFARADESIPEGRDRPGPEGVAW